MSKSGSTPVMLSTFLMRWLRPTSASLRPDLWQATKARTSAPTAMEATEGTSGGAMITSGALWAWKASWNISADLVVMAPLTERMERPSRLPGWESTLNGTGLTGALYVEGSRESRVESPEWCPNRATEYLAG